MKDKAIRALLRVREREYEETLRFMAAAIQLLDAASGRVKCAEEALVQERDIALSPLAEDAAVEHYAAWLPHGQKALQVALDEMNRQTAETARARSTMIMARAALKAVQTLDEQRALQKRLATLKAEQNTLDDFGGQTASPDQKKGR